jgi:DNA-binding response OmpR family regulator
VGTTAPETAFSVNPSKKQISFRGQPLELSKYEYDILSTLIRRPGHVFSREELMQQVWEQPEMSLDRSVDAHIKNLRAKLRTIDPDVDSPPQRLLAAGRRMSAVSVFEPLDRCPPSEFWFGPSE